ncbi:MAG: DUF2284 domain-containing protein [candidate division KSB1 bacterium]|nr:DUF2284 domain-containing protein [candidate division KSB1 bacterium]
MQTYIQKACHLGATSATVIDASLIKVAEWVRLKCQFGCGAYGGCLTCPPFSPSPQVTQKMLEDYSHALLLRFDQISPEKEDTIRRLTRKVVSELERTLFLDGYYKAFGLTAGPCPLCDPCDITAPCKHPREARPALEACGIDVYQTVRNAGQNLEVVPSEDSCFTLVSLILIE